MNIGFDLDGVLVDWHSVALTELYNLGKTYNSISDFFERFGNSKIFDFLVSLPFLYTRPVPKKRDLEVLNKIAKTNVIFYITARPKSVTNLTESYLKKYNFPCYGNIIFTDSKSKVINSLEIALFLEDRPDFIEDILRNSPDCLPVMFSREWNNNYAYEHVVSSVEEFYAKYIAERY